MKNYRVVTLARLLLLSFKSSLQVIRSSLTDKREKYYDSKNIGCYMFKIDDHLVVDATMKGNAARFINHSCEVISLPPPPFFLSK